MLAHFSIFDKQRVPYVLALSQYSSHLKKDLRPKAGMNRS